VPPERVDGRRSAPLPDRRDELLEGRMVGRLLTSVVRRALHIHPEPGGELAGLDQHDSTTA
jgi:hypothetical protein